jgi:hypothetical protein
MELLRLKAALILCTLDTIHILFFVTRLIINQINKVQWVDFKLENVLVSLHSLKTMGLQFKVKLKPIYQNLVETTFDTNNYCSPTLVS